MTIKITNLPDGYLVELQTDKGKTYDKVIARRIEFENFCWHKGRFGGREGVNNMTTFSDDEILKLANDYAVTLSCKEWASKNNFIDGMKYMRELYVKQFMIVDKRNKVDL